MSITFPADRRRRATTVSTLPLLLALLLCGCGVQVDAPPDAASPAPEEPVDARLQCLPTSLVALALPLPEGFAVAHADAGATPVVAKCVLSLFDRSALKTPAAFDRAYGRVFAYHEEDGTLAPATIPHRDLQLFRLGDTDGANIWLLRIDTGNELEDAHLDVLFSTARSNGALVDQLLVGAMGLLYRRDYDIEATDAFAIREETGHAREAGPGYRASYRIAPDGRFALVSGEVLEPPR